MAPLVAPRARRVPIYRRLSATEKEVRPMLAAMLSVLMRLLDHLIFQTPLTLATLTAWPASFLLLIAPPVALALRP
jgi:hypothetical protein